MAAISETTLTIGSARHTALVAGPEGAGETVLFIHGFPDSPLSFSHQTSAMADAGYRVVAPFSRGYEPSSIPPDQRFDIIDLANDTVAFVDAIGAERVHLVGHDWGAATAFVAATVAPDRFASVAALSVPHPARFAEAIRPVPIQLAYSWYMSFFQLGTVAEKVSRRNHFALWRWLWDRWSPGYRISDEDWARLATSFAEPGVASAMLAYYRQNTSPARLLGLKKTGWNQMTTVPVRTLAISGADDRCIHPKMWDRGIVEAHYPAGVTIHRVADAGHWLLLEQPEATTELLIGWFRNLG